MNPPSAQSPAPGAVPGLRSRRLACIPERGGEVLTTRVGLQMPSGLTFETWERAGRTLAGIVDSSAWWLGDWLVYGKENYADRYERGIRTAGLKYQTLRNYAWVSRRFAMGRRRPRLSFQHHAEVASLPVEEQDRWLDSAERHVWTTKRLRTAIQNARLGDEDTARTANATRRLEVPHKRFREWSRAAECSGVELDTWVMTTLDRAAERTLDDRGPLVEQP
ncbi:LmbU family transcriptional regulator [Streptomyces griseus]|uniref:LmbU family transcriptional regulator n=1 Tax=Streptomyces griseus group TaxID=629295 RepID=UPI0036ABA46D